MRIKELREKLGLTQGLLASALGLDRSTVAKWETGEAKPRANTLPELAKALGCTIDELYRDAAEAV